MIIDRLQKEILESENLLLDLSKQAFTIKKVDSMADWIVNVLNEDGTLPTYLHFPTERKLRTAIVTLIKNVSGLTNPLVHLLSNRIGVYLGTVDDVFLHPLRSAVLDNIVHNFTPLNKLLHKHKNNFKHVKTLLIIANALKENNLDIYKSHLKDTDLRVVLRALFQDKNRDDNDAVHAVLEYSFSELQKEMKKNGYIQPHRHCWWAIYTIFREANQNWLQDHKLQLENVLEYLISLPDSNLYPRLDVDYGNVVPEINSLFNEKAWITINIIRILKSDLTAIISVKTIALLKKKAESDIDVLLKMHHDDSIKFLLSKLILLYESLSYYNIQETLKFVGQDSIAVDKFKVGSYYYDESVLKDFISIKAKVKSLLDKPTLYKKPTLGSILLSGSAGQGKSELAIQVAKDLGDLALQNDKQFIKHYFTIGTDITSTETLFEAFSLIDENDNADNLKLIVFDEFDKATFDFYTPFLPYLEKSIATGSSIKIYIFAQSSYPKANMLNDYANSLANKAMRDFLTRLQMGSIDLPDIKFSPVQKMFSVIGMAKARNLDVNEISRKLLAYFALNDDLKNMRQLFANFTDKAEIIQDGLQIKPEHQRILDNLYPNLNGAIKLID
ncbi:hypothetical protein GCM10023149_47480 [Mucilaginibacter gynuensis]|uniref:ATPase family protein associated with various cellular activities (AAA) n=1 Tax=Mucilaginibacter gynuensis TaxID=1302236 RepID=A0ABP8HDE9_9SPHI